MSASYQSILWNRQKKIYDIVILGLLTLYLATFIGSSLLRNPEITQETLIIRAFGTLSILLLHIILLIGPLARLNSAFLPLLYNRRHLGVTTFFCATIHGIFSIIQFHGLGNRNQVLSVFTSNMHYESLTRFPFQTFGFCALVILFLMAITSHDFWLNMLGPRMWKALHMLVYIAYGFIILHVLLGIIQFETSPLFVTLLGMGLLSVIIAHLLSSAQEHRLDQQRPDATHHGFIKICNVDDIPENRAKVVSVNQERIAIFRYNNKVSAISNVCKHQNGPLGEGRIIDGCITCPWHGYQYLPHNGSSPAPFKEKVATYDVKVINREIWINPVPYPEGTERVPAIIN